MREELTGVAQAVSLQAIHLLVEQQGVVMLGSPVGVDEQGDGTQDAL